MICRFFFIAAWVLCWAIGRLPVVGGESEPQWQTNAWGRQSRVEFAVARPPGFTPVDSAASGITFSNRLSIERSLTNHILLNGSGVALGDVDGDGWIDIFFASLGGGSCFYRNLGGWRFTNLTSEAFNTEARVVLAGLDATGAVFADVDGDGDLDLLVNSIRKGTHLFLNDGHGRFVDVTATAGLAGISGATSFALADIDGDGDLDIYVVNYRSSTVRDEFRQRFEIKRVNGLPKVAAVNGRSTAEPDLVGRFEVDGEGHVTEHGEADTLYLNDGHGRFTPVSFTGGAFRDEAATTLISPPYDWGLAAMFRDIDGDGFPDLYVCNDLNSPDRIWLNDRHGGFRAAPRLAVRKTSWFSMGIDFGDLNRDGFDDFLVTDMLSRDPVRRQIEMARRQAEPEPYSGSEARPQAARNTLQLGRGDGTFAEAAWFAGLQASDWSWSPVFLDVDLDGYEDILISTGFERDVQDADVAEEIEALRQRDRLSDAAALQLRLRFPSLALPNTAFRNRRDLTFEEAGKAWGFDQSGISQGMALADLDNDGDLDVVINRQNASALLLRNEATMPRIAVRLHGLAPNTQGIGARLEVDGGPVRQTQEIVSGGRYLSGDDPVRVFAAGSLSNRLSIRVHWRSGRESRLAGLEPNQRVELYEPADRAAPEVPSVPAVKPLFEDVSGLLGHRHHEEPCDDFQRQPLLSRKLSQAGPAACWGDINRDGFDDLVIGSGRGGKLGVFLNDGHGAFIPGRQAVFDRDAPLDYTGLLIWPAGTNSPLLLAALSSYEAPQAAAGVRIFDLETGTMRFGGPSLPAAIGALAAGDIDGDGEPDLFVGGRVIPGKYPAAAPSALFLSKNHQFAAAADNRALLSKLGLATGAVFADLDGDGAADLVVACEWGPIHIFYNRQGILTERNVPLTWEGGGDHPATLGAATGLWNGIAAVDLDGDGRLDLVAANWGRNTKYQLAAGREVRAYHGDFNGDGVYDLLESYIDPKSGRELPFASWETVAFALPAVREQFVTRRAFGEASVEQILGRAYTTSEHCGAVLFDSMIFLNRGGYFLARPLPMAAQLAPAFAVVAADFDGDGNEDIFLSQNFFDASGETDRDDAGLGLLLKGDGKGGLASMGLQASGIRIPGEQRSAATADYDGDGRPDLVVTQNSDTTHLLRNVTGRPGLRVRIAGPGCNPTGIGVKLRLVYPGGHMGPVREIHGGGGYWSQDGQVTVLGKAEEPESLWLKWPGKDAASIPLKPGQREVVVKAP